jgi:hypothetical protein
MPTAAPLPTAPPTSPRDAEEVDLLLHFVHERDVRCPRCEYNLRNLTQPVCPECRQDLHLSVGLTRPTFHWLLLALAPGIFSGIAAFFMLIIVLVAFTRSPGPIPWQGFAINGFGWLSGAFAFGLLMRRWWFLKRSHAAQVSAVGVVWFVHIAFFFIMWALLP